ncbi:MAG: FHA domain-containing protein [Saprospiraceae bacterium]|nr:FHA domain-containing protein [Saprospiraceae bacterium]
MSRPTQKQSFGNTIRQGIQMLSGKNVENYTLVFLDPTSEESRNSEQTIWNPYITLGRGRDCTIRYSDVYSTVSRRHAVIRVNVGHYFIEPNADATNPTLVNGQPVNGSKELQSGDEIQLSFEGPRIRFINTPVHKSTANMNFTQRFREFGKQAFRPYKQAIAILSLLLLGLCIFLSLNYFKTSETLRAIDSKVEKNDSLTREVKEENEKMKYLYDRITKIKPPVTKTNSNLNIAVKDNPSIPPSLKELENSIYFIYITNVQVYHPRINDSSKPFELDKDLSYRWSGTGFLTEDGSFVTARHVIQPWRFNIKCEGLESDDLDQQVKTFLNNAEITGGKVEITYKAIAPNGDNFTFTNADVKMDISKDILECGGAEKGFGVKKCTQGNSDWAVFKFANRKGKLKINNELAKGLPKGTEIFGLGYSYGDWLQSNAKIEPLLIEGKVVQSKTTNGMISIAASALAPGSSGGPIMIKMADGSYAVIGIISSGLPEVKFLVPISEIW